MAVLHWTDKPWRSSIIHGHHSTIYPDVHKQERHFEIETNLTQIGSLITHSTAETGRLFDGVGQLVNTETLKWIAICFRLEG